MAQKVPCSIETSPGPSPVAHSPASSQILPYQLSLGLHPEALAPTHFRWPSPTTPHTPPTFTVPTCLRLGSLGE